MRILLSEEKMLTVKMIASEPFIGRKRIGEVKKNSKEIWSEGVAPLRLVEKGTLHQVLPVDLQYGNSWTFEQDNGTRHTRVMLPRFLDKDSWPTNSSDLNPLDDCI